MCDALGANGILRVYTYSIKHGKPFFDRNIFPIENLTADEYTKRCAAVSYTHLNFFNLIPCIYITSIISSSK